MARDYKHNTVKYEPPFIRRPLDSRCQAVFVVIAEIRPLSRIPGQPPDPHRHLFIQHFHADEREKALYSIPRTTLGSFRTLSSPHSAGAVALPALPLDYAVASFLDAFVVVVADFLRSVSAPLVPRDIRYHGRVTWRDWHVFGESLLLNFILYIRRRRRRHTFRGEEADVLFYNILSFITRQARVSWPVSIARGQ